MGSEGGQTLGTEARAVGSASEGASSLWAAGGGAGRRGTGDKGEDVCVTARVSGSRLSAPAFPGFVLNFFF